MLRLFDKQKNFFSNGLLAITVKKFFGIVVSIINWKKTYIKFVKTANSNMVNVVYNLVSNANEDELFLLQRETLATIIHKNAKKLAPKDFCDIILMHGDKSLINFSKLDKRSILYKEHIDKVLNGEILWQYSDAGTFVKSTVFSFEEGDIYMSISAENKPVELEEYKKLSLMHFEPLNIRRKFVPGLTIREYLMGKSEEEKLETVERLIKHIFDTYSLEDGRISGKLCDCHMNNFIIDKDLNFHFIDLDYVYDGGIDKEYCVYKMLCNDKKWYKLMLDKFGMEDRSKYYKKNFNIELHQQKSRKLRVITPKYLELKNKYFGDKGVAIKF